MMRDDYQEKGWAQGLGSGQPARKELYYWSRREAEASSLDRAVHNASVFVAGQPYGAEVYVYRLVPVKIVRRAGVIVEDVP